MENHQTTNPPGSRIRFLFAKAQRPEVSLQLLQRGVAQRGLLVLHEEDVTDGRVREEDPEPPAKRENAFWATNSLRILGFKMGKGEKIT